jgi:uncharacterized protein
VIIVSNTTAITTLLKIGRTDVLESLFGRVLIPTAVKDELLGYHKYLPQFCEVHPVSKSTRLELLLRQAGKGEAEAVALAVELKANVLLIDDKKGRRLAQAEGISCLGLPALVLAAKQKRLIISVAQFLNLLEQQGNYCLSTHAKTEILRQSNE